MNNIFISEGISESQMLVEEMHMMAEEAQMSIGSLISMQDMYAESSGGGILYKICKMILTFIKKILQFVIKIIVAPFALIANIAEGNSDSDHKSSGGGSSASGSGTGDLVHSAFGAVFDALDESLNSIRSIGQKDKKFFEVGGGKELELFTISDIDDSLLEITVKINDQLTHMCNTTDSIEGNKFDNRYSAFTALYKSYVDKLMVITNKHTDKLLNAVRTNVKSGKVTMKRAGSASTSILVNLSKAYARSAVYDKTIKRGVMIESLLLNSVKTDIEILKNTQGDKSIAGTGRRTVSGETMCKNIAAIKFKPPVYYNSEFGKIKLKDHKEHVDVTIDEYISGYVVDFFSFINQYNHDKTVYITGVLPKIFKDGRDEQISRNGRNISHRIRSEVFNDILQEKYKQMDSRINSSSAFDAELLKKLDKINDKFLDEAKTKINDIIREVSVTEKWIESNDPNAIFVGDRTFMNTQQYNGIVETINTKFTSIRKSSMSLLTDVAQYKTDIELIKEIPNIYMKVLAIGFLYNMANKWMLEVQAKEPEIRKNIARSNGITAERLKEFPKMLGDIKKYTEENFHEIVANAIHREINKTDVLLRGKKPRK